MARACAASGFDPEPGLILAFGDSMLAGRNLKVFLIFLWTGLALSWLPANSYASRASEEIKIQIPMIQLPSTEHAEGTYHRFEFGFSGYARVSDRPKSGESRQLVRELFHQVGLRSFEWQILTSRPHGIGTKANDSINATLVFAHVNSGESRALLNSDNEVEVLRLTFNQNQQLQKLYPNLKKTDTPRLQVNFAQKLVWILWPESPDAQPSWQKFDFDGNPILPGWASSIKHKILSSCQALLGQESAPEEWPKEQF